MGELTSAPGRNYRKFVAEDSCLNGGFAMTKLLFSPEVWEASLTTPSRRNKPMFEINLMGLGQAEALAELQSVTFREAYSDVHSPENREAYCRNNCTAGIAAADLDSGDTVCCVGLIDSKSSGYYIVTHQLSPVAPKLSSSELKQIYIVNSAYGSGLGAGLYHHALETIRSAGNKSVWLCVSDINSRAQSFYGKLGFELAGTGPTLEVGDDKLSSSILINEL